VRHPRLILSIVLGACAAAASIGLLATAAWLISRAAQHPPESAIALAIVAVQFFGLSRGLFRYAQRLTGHDAAFRALGALRLRVYDRLEQLLPGRARTLRSGDVMARFVTDVESLQDQLLRVLTPFAVALVVGVATVALVWSILPAAGAILAAALLVAATAVPWSSARRAARREAGQAEARGALTAAVVDLLWAAPELAANGTTGVHLARASGIGDELAGVEAEQARTAGLGRGFAALLPALAMVGSLAVGIVAVHDGRLAPVLLAVIAVVPLAAFELSADLPAAAQTRQRVRQSLGRADAVLQLPPAVLEPALPEPIPGSPFPLRVRGLRCRHPGAERWALDGVDLDLHAGSRVGIVGRSGAGKTTLAEVLLRFVPYQEGSVTVGETELSALRGDDCRELIGLVAQDAHVFNTTLRANLSLARPGASDDELRRALGRVHLLEWSETLPHGLDTELGEFGSRMSGGQRQRLAAARSILAAFPILILDEPAEHLDAGTADSLVDALLAGPPEQAIVLITHDARHLDAMDEVITLEAGRRIG
jgi:thiol reductant ABC exporter CydC subunit